METIFLIAIFQCSYLCDMTVEHTNLCNLPVIEWYVEEDYEVLS